VVDKLTAKQVKDKIKGFNNLENAYDWLDKTNRLEYFAWFLSGIVLERAGIKKRVGYEIHHIIPLREGLSKEILLDINNFEYISKEKHKELENMKEKNSLR